MNVQDFRGWSIEALTTAYRSGTVSPINVAEWALSEANQLSSRYGTVFTYIAEDAALEAAYVSQTRWRKGEELGPLDGVPATVKNLLAVRGWPLDFCSLTVDPGDGPNYDAPAVARLREAGVVMLGYTSTPEFSWKLTTESSKYGATGNPHDPSRTAGGSSGGAAVAAALGLAPVNLATDAAGSIRVPASFCGVAGMKPTFGCVAAFPAGPLTHVGTIAQRIEDVAQVMDIIGQPDSRDWTNTPICQDKAFSKILGKSITGLHIAYARTFCGLRAVAEVEVAVEQSVQVLSRLGANVEMAEPNLPDPRAIIRTLFSTGYMSRLRSLNDEALQKVDPGLKGRVREGAELAMETLLRAHESRLKLGSDMHTFFDRFDLLVMPTVAVPAFELGRSAPADFSGADFADWSLFTYPFNLGQNPAATVPCGKTSKGLPIGIQIVGRKFDDARVIGVAKALQEHCPVDFS